MSDFIPFNFSKSLMIESEWKTLKCEKCGGEMELEKSTEFEEVKKCKSCGWNVLFIKKLRKDFE